MNPSVAGFRTYFGVIFADEQAWPTDFIQLHLDDCMIEVRPCVFGKYYLRALYYLTAHYIVMYKDINNKALLVGPNSTAFASAKGVISSKSVGDLSMSMEMPEYNKTSDDKFLAYTIFGQEFIRLRNKMTKGPLLANQIPSPVVGC